MVKTQMNGVNEDSKLIFSALFGPNILHDLCLP